ncbi:MAG: citrate/2-methylcitrate synthase [Candidatus Njordarchaeia archaeon]
MSQQPEIHKGLDGIIVATSKLSYIDGAQGKLYYAGYRIEDIAKYSTFEEVAYLMWNGKLPTKSELEELSKMLKENRSLPSEVIEMMRKLPKNSHPMDVLKLAVSALGPFDPELSDGSHEANYRKAIRITAKFPTIVATWHNIREGRDPIEPNPNLDHAANFLYMMFGEKPDEFKAKTMDVALMLHVEHGMNASTFSCIVTASTLSDLYSSITAGVATLKGPLHGGANERALKMLREIGNVDNVEKYIEEKLAKKERIMGFGHRVYKSYDPRARIFKSYVEKISEMTGDKTLFEIAKKVEEVMIAKLGAKGIFPNIDFYSGIVYNALGIPSDLFTPIFAIARVVGWTAHVLEYLQENRLVRPRQLFVGELDREYIPIDKRG